MITGKKYEHIWLNVGSTRIWESSTEKLLGVIIDSNLKFDIHVNSLIKIAGRKLTAMSRLSRVLSFSKLRMLITSIFESQFAYCPLVWMFCSRSLNGNINTLHERAMRILYKDDITNFQDLLIKDGSETIHDRNIKLLAIETSICTVQKLCFPDSLHIESLHTLIYKEHPENMRQIGQMVLKTFTPPY